MQSIEVISEKSHQKSTFGITNIIKHSITDKLSKYKKRTSPLTL